jgi:hypothetical protein
LVLFSNNFFTKWSIIKIMTWFDGRSTFSIVSKCTLYVKDNLFEISLILQNKNSTSVQFTIYF